MVPLRKATSTGSNRPLRGDDVSRHIAEITDASTPELELVFATV